MLALDGDLLGRGVVLGACVAAPAGPVGLLYMRRALHQGWLAGVVCGLGAATAVGLCGGLVAIALGAATTLVGNDLALRAAGGVVLLALGATTARARPARRAAPAHGSGPVAGYAAAFGATIASPAAIGLFVAVVASLGAGLPGDSDRAAAVAAGLFGGSVAWFVASSAALALVVRRPSLRLLTWVNRAAGLALVGCGGSAVLAALAG
jgi:threonine/homoserine/homoserine lactone efflux protein